MRYLARIWDRVLITIGIVLYSAVFSYLGILRHYAFASGLDLGNMDQTVWNTIQGRIFTLSTDAATTSRFAHHADLFLILISPIYLIWDSPHMLNILESVYLSLGSIPVYLIAKRVLKDKLISLGIVAMYFLSPLLEWVDIFDFHSVSFAIPAILAAFYCALTRRWRWYMVFIALALFTKEEISMQIMLLGFIIAFVFNEKKIGLSTAAAGFFWFILMTFVVIPHFSAGGQHWALKWYSFANIQHIVSPQILTYYSLILKSTGFLPLLGFPWLILAAPELAINVLSSHPEMHSIQYHYPAGLIPGLVLASIYGLLYVKWAWLRYTLLVVGLLIVLRTNYHYSPLPTTQSCWCKVYDVSSEDREFEQILQNIPTTASVTASTEIHAHVTHRENSYLLPHATQSADFIALIDQNRVIDNYGPKPYELDLIKKLYREGRYNLVSHIGHFYLFSIR